MPPSACSTALVRYACFYLAKPLPPAYNPLISSPVESQTRMRAMINCCKNMSLVLLFAMAGSAAAADRKDSTPQKTPKLDLYGDPLPAGAIARIGSIRLRHTGLSDLVYLQGGKIILSAGADRVLRWWDRASGRPIQDMKLQGVGGPGFCQTLSPDGKYMVAQDGQNLVFWHVATGKELKKLPTGAQNSVM